MTFFIISLSLHITFFIMIIFCHFSDLCLDFSTFYFWCFLSWVWCVMIEHILDGARVGHRFFRFWRWLRGWTWTTNLRIRSTWSFWPLHEIDLSIVIWRHRRTTHKWPLHTNRWRKNDNILPLLWLRLRQHRLMVEYSMLRVTLGPPPHATPTHYPTEPRSESNIESLIHDCGRCEVRKIGGQAGL